MYITLFRHDIICCEKEILKQRRGSRLDKFYECRKSSRGLHCGKEMFYQLQ